MRIFMVLSFNECRLSDRWPLTLRPSQPTWPVSPPVGCYHPHPPSPFISITQPVGYVSRHLVFNRLDVSGMCTLARPLVTLRM